MVRDRPGCGPTPGLEGYGLCAPPQPIRSSPSVSGCQAAYFAASVPGPLYAGATKLHGSVCHSPGGNGNQGAARALDNTPAELTRLSRNKPDGTAVPGSQPDRVGARGEREAPVPHGATTNPNKRLP